MSGQTANRAPWSFWVINVLMLFWNVMGCINFFVQMNPDIVTSYRESEQAIISGRPAWATAAFAIAVFGGAFGCLLLMLKKPIAYYMFIFSLLDVVVTITHTLNTGIDFGIGEIAGIILMPFVVAVFLIWYSKYAEKKNWLNI